MKWRAKVAVCSEFRTKHSTQSEHDVEFLYVCYNWWYVKKPLGFKYIHIYFFYEYNLYHFPSKIFETSLLFFLSPLLCVTD
jgi:hypothetical protein